MEQASPIEGKTYFYAFFTKENFERVFLETTFFDLATTILKNPLHRSGSKFKRMFTTCIILVRTRIRFFHEYLLTFLNNLNYKNMVEKLKIPPFCYFKFFFNNSTSDHSHLCTLLGSILIFDFRRSKFQKL